MGFLGGGGLMAAAGLGGGGGSALVSVELVEVGLDGGQVGLGYFPDVTLGVGCFKGCGGVGGLQRAELVVGGHQRRLGRSGAVLGPKVGGVRSDPGGLPGAVESLHLRLSRCVAGCPR